MRIRICTQAWKKRHASLMEGIRDEMDRQKMEKWLEKTTTAEQKLERQGRLMSLSRKERHAEVKRFCEPQRPDSSSKVPRTARGGWLALQKPTRRMVHSRLPSGATADPCKRVAQSVGPEGTYGNNPGRAQVRMGRGGARLAAL